MRIHRSWTFALIAIPVLTLATGGIGYACTSGQGGGGGSGGSGSGSGQILWISADAQSATSYVTCSPHSISSPTSTLSVQASNLAPGTSCVLTATLMNYASYPLELQSSIKITEPKACSHFTYVDNLGSGGSQFIGALGEYSYQSTLSLAAIAGNACEAQTATVAVTISGSTNGCGCGAIGSSISTNFNGQSIHSGSYVWFSSDLTWQQSAPKSPVTVFFEGQTITFPKGSGLGPVHPPDAMVTFSPSASSASTSYNSTISSWVTTVPASFNGNVFLSGYTFLVPSGGVAANLKNIVWNGTFSGTSAYTIQWSWSAAAYSSFSTNYNLLGVKSTHSTTLDPYKNGDQAGTPESYKTYVISGGTGGGGSNCTGSYSATTRVQDRC